MLGDRVRGGPARLPGPLARSALSHAAVPARRRALKTLAWVGIGGGALAVAQSQWPWRERLADSLADLRTGTGERSERVLADGTRLLLNTATSVDIDFDATRRLIVLHGGEIMVVTAHDPAGRPLQVRTREGLLTPIGTRFTVRRDATSSSAPGFTRLAVQVGAVEIRVASVTPVLVRAGEQSHFTDGVVEAPSALDEAAQSWVDGTLMAERMRLADLLAELGRYRSGRLRCDPAVADLRVTGIWPLDGSDPSERVLASLERTLPVTVSRLTRYWVTVGPRASR
ncbi:FecR family protein [soil metagenome]